MGNLTSRFSSDQTSAEPFQVPTTTAAPTESKQSVMWCANGATCEFPSNIESTQQLGELIIQTMNQEKE